jgi:hypothetical protein
MRRRGPSLKGATPQKRGPKPKQATQDQYLAIAKYIYHRLGAGYPMESAVQAARKAFPLYRNGVYKPRSRKGVYEAVAQAKIGHKKELERERAEADPYSDPPPDVDPESARRCESYFALLKVKPINFDVWTAEKQFWLSQRKKFRAGEMSHEPKITVVDAPSEPGFYTIGGGRCVKASPRKLELLATACPKCGWHGKANTKQGWFCTRCKCALDIPTQHIRWVK